MAALNVQGMLVGAGMPKIIVPVMGAQPQDVIAGLKQALAAGPDCIEWRADHCDAIKALAEAGAATDGAELAKAQLWLAEFAAELKAAAMEGVAGGGASVPLLFTIRTAEQGGEVALSAEAYAALVQAAIDTDAFALVDIELCKGDDAVRKLIEAAQAKGVTTVVSEHDFEKTPATEQMEHTLCAMRALGADIPKLAVMANSREDTARLLAATSNVVFEQGVAPVITMAMGGAGAMSRLAGESFGSAMTFASVEEASAPGQMSIAQTRAALAALRAALS